MQKRSIFLLLITLSIFLSGKAESYKYALNENIKFESKVEEALKYSKTHKMNTSYCIMVDMSIHSGKNRLFVYDFKKKEVVIKGVCAHGNGGGSSANKPVYSNKIGSNCTSLGKYKLGKRAYSNWGINVHYKMHGLEKTNSNAFKRIVVLHSYTHVPAFESYPLPVFNVSYGCPVIANATMRKIDELIKSGQKDMLLWIYE
ncbi:murein L,D-transpeptidase catalytic domain-containing protein [Pedobacter foliorum]|uniref:murein L,D-transpeptidase catalytic domain-containing protein n=1 Tax=Pedobacter foliorum TaxID=2739058 RepID=UPI00156440C1|nr:murein L,D-transpeptidase catalytic domain family protein [Pedobacter foliorum]NRF40338.1 murein L,D-transpeptidase catalytic domain family protein [Pedobacter foliorum]